MNINSVGAGVDIPSHSTTNTRANIKASPGSGNEQVSLGIEANVYKQMRADPGYIPTVQERHIIKNIEQANKKLAGDSREFNFSIHEKTKQIMIKVINSETKEVIKEVPPEKILDMVATMCEMAGLFVDVKKGSVK